MRLPHCLDRADRALVKRVGDTVGPLKSPGNLLGIEWGLNTIRSIKLIRSNPWGRATKMQLQDVKGAVVELSPERLRSHLAALGSKNFSGWILKSQYRKGVLTLEGAGFGHGVGLCQYGAEARARSGMTWREICLFRTPEQKSQTTGDHDLAFNQ